MKFAIIALLVAVAAGLSGADKGEKEIAEISQADLQAAIAAKQVTLIDVNGTESWKQGHIPGAIDFETHKADLASLLPKDKGALVVAYCGGPACMAYKSGAHAAEGLGYTNVKHFKGGISGWKDSGQPVEAGKAEAH